MCRFLCAFAAATRRSAAVFGFRSLCATPDAAPAATAAAAASSSSLPRCFNAARLSLARSAAVLRCMRVFCCGVGCGGVIRKGFEQEKKAKKTGCFSTPHASHLRDAPPFHAASVFSVVALTHAFSQLIN
jgi:hypothetical protein